MPVHNTWDGKEYMAVYFEPLFCKKEINPAPSRDPDGVIWCLECAEEHCPIRYLFSEVKELEEKLELAEPETVEEEGGMRGRTTGDLLFEIGHSLDEICTGWSQKEDALIEVGLHDARRDLEELGKLIAEVSG